MSALPGLQPEPAGTEATFHEPWQARAFALVVLLHRKRHFTWDAWVRTLAMEVETSPQRADEDADQAYHRQFLTALESVVAARGLVAPDMMAARKRAWRQAYENTPHGQPVDLAAADMHDDHEHDHHEDELVAQRAPVKVSPAQAQSGVGSQTGLGT